MLEELVQETVPGRHLHFHECKADPHRIKTAWETDKNLNLLCNLLQPRPELETFCKTPLRNVIVLLQDYVASDFLSCTDSFFSSATDAGLETVSLFGKYVPDLPKYSAAILYVNDMKFWNWTREYNPYQDFLIRLAAIAKAAFGRILILDSCTRVKRGFKEALAHVDGRIEYVKIS